MNLKNEMERKNYENLDADGLSGTSYGIVYRRLATTFLGYFDLTRGLL